MVQRLYEQRAEDLSPLQLIDLFEAYGVPRAKIEAAMAHDPDGRGALRDRMAADMTNRVFADLGINERRTAPEIKRLREREETVASTQRPQGDVRPPRSSR